MSLGAKRRLRRERVYHAAELAAVTPPALRGRTEDPHAEARAGLLAERARLLGQLAAVGEALREMDDD